MLTVTVRLDPWWGGQDPKYSKELAVATIYNDGSGGHDKGNYVAMAHDMRSDKIKRATTVQGYPRLSEDVWNLVADALEGMGYGS